jgi:hypothetical protein
VRDEVWPDFEDFITGGRRAEIRADAGVLARELPILKDREKLIADILWNEELRFRVAVTVDPECDCVAVPAHLFAGYDKTVPGLQVERRRAETFPLAIAMRDWMDAFCDEVKQSLDSARRGHRKAEREVASGDLEIESTQRKGTGESQIEDPHPSRTDNV